MQLASTVSPAQGHLMPLPSDFHFSQGSLQDYVDCQRRFQLRYLERIAWPAVEVEPVLENEQHLRQGALFHLMVQQHLIGVPVERLTAMTQDEDLGRWWRNYLAAAPAAVKGMSYPELALSAPFGGDGLQRLVAKYDLVVVTPEGRALIFDWKTARQRSPSIRLAKRLQTRVYPYLLVQAGADLNDGKPFEPGQIEMIYWFADFPDRPERFVYSPAQYAEDGGYLAGLLEQIAALSLGDGMFPLTEVEERCRFCVYRSLCDRGIAAGSLDEMAFDEPEPEGSFDFELDFEQIAEIEY